PSEEHPCCKIRVRDILRQLYQIGPPTPFAKSGNTLSRANTQLLKAGILQLLQVHSSSISSYISFTARSVAVPGLWNISFATAIRTADLSRPSTKPRSTAATVSATFVTLVEALASSS